MTMRYRHRQVGWVMLIGLGIGAAALLALSAFLATRLPASAPFVPIVLLSVGALQAVLMVLFSSLTAEVTDRDLTWYFGPRFWKNRLALSDIEKATAIEGKWYWGYGIKYFGPNRWLYNVSGLEAVEVSLKSGGWVRIGTDDPAGLVQALRERGH